MIKTFRKGDKVRSTKAAYNLFQYRGGLQHGVVTSDQRSPGRVTVLRNGQKTPSTYAVIFWKLEK